MQLARLIRFSLAGATICGGMLLSSCATILKGSTQKVPISSEPAGASVVIDGAASGVTPTEAKLSRKISHRVELNKTGYKPYEVVLEPSFNGATIGNVIAGGIIGMAVDSSTGATNTLYPHEVKAVLQKR